MTDVRVLQIVTSTDRRGAETFAVELGDALADDFSIETVALAAGSGPGLPLEPLGTSPRSWSTLRALRTRARSVDVVVAHGSTTLPACALALAGSRTPFVYRNIGDPTYWTSDPVRRWRTTTFLSRARRVVALGDGAARTLLERHRVRCERLQVIPTGVAGSRFHPASDAARVDARVQLGVEDAHHVAAVVGALSPEKAVDRAIRAFVDTPELGTLVVAGDGPGRGELEELARAAGSRVRFLGSLDDPSVVYRASDLVLLTSRTEGLPAVLIEAGLCGLPVVTTDVGYVRDIVTDGVTGIVVASGDPEDIGAAVHAARLLGPGVGAAARAHCLERFSLDVVARRWRDLLVEVTG